MSNLDPILVTVMTVNEKPQKRDPTKLGTTLGIPEQTKRSARSKVTQVKPIRKYFWSKRSDEYLQKKERARQEQKARVSKPREFISAMVQNWALTDVLSQVLMLQAEFFQKQHFFTLFLKKILKGFSIFFIFLYC